MRKVDIKRFAKHEAGHAVNFVLNFSESFEFVWVRRTDDEAVPYVAGTVQRSGRHGGGVFFQPNPSFFTTTFELVKNCMAGVAGERINRKKPGRFTFVDILTGAGSDYEEARRHIRESNEQRLSRWVVTDEGKYMNTCLAAAWRTLKAHRAAHEEVTRLLIERGRLTYDAVREIVYDHIERACSKGPTA